MTFVTDDVANFIVFILPEQAKVQTRISEICLFLRIATKRNNKSSFVHRSILLRPTTSYIYEKLENNALFIFPNTLQCKTFRTKKMDFIKLTLCIFSASDDEASKVFPFLSQNFSKKYCCKSS